MYLFACWQVKRNSASADNPKAVLQGLLPLISSQHAARTLLYCTPIANFFYLTSTVLYIAQRECAVYCSAVRLFQAHY
jgi:type VI protein secretion system component VasA